jgi:hypothetical protein
VTFNFEAQCRGCEAISQIVNRNGVVTFDWLLIGTILLPEKLTERISLKAFVFFLREAQRSKWRDRGFRLCLAWVEPLVSVTVAVLNFVEPF